jgi:hypothetical protein
LLISGDILKEKAAQFWPKLYPRIDPPKFSSSWLKGFKARQSIKSRKKYSEAADVDLKAYTKVIHNVQVCTSEYPLSDIYNIDESGLYWKMVPDISLLTEQLFGTKKEKAWISLAILANRDSTERLKMWIIGNTKRLRCFKNININNLGIKW